MESTGTSAWCRGTYPRAAHVREEARPADLLPGVGVQGGRSRSSVAEVYARLGGLLVTRRSKYSTPPQDDFPAAARHSAQTPGILSRGAEA